MKFPKRFREIGIISIILIVSLSYGLYFFLQDLTEYNIKTNLFEQQRLRQLDANNAISQHISSDIDSILSKLKVVAASVSVQQGNLTNSDTEHILQEMFNESKQLVGKADYLFIVDRNDTIILIASDQEEQRALVGTDISFRDYANQTRTTLKSVLSTGLLGLEGTYRIVITYPIVNRETGQYLGFVGAGIPTVEFFERFGNVYDIKSQYLAALDRNATHLIHSNPLLIGKDFFGEFTQNFTRHNEDLNNLMKKVLLGESGDVVYTIGLGERLTTGFPTFISDNNRTGISPYVVFIVTPTSQIYSQFENILFTQRIETFSLLAISTAAAIILIIFLIKWSSNLDKEVKNRTRELELANKQLKINDNIRKEFINVAAHELRTPTQSIVGYSELLAIDPENSRSYINPIVRNAKRLQKLSEDILDVTRIEIQSLILNKEKFDLDEVISSLVGDYRSILFDDEKRANLNIEYEPRSVTVNADKERISQVISNLLNNAVRFSAKEKGTVTIITQEKSIIEAHGGKIWAKNNIEDRGAKFSFVLPLV